MSVSMSVFNEGLLMKKIIFALAIISSMSAFASNTLECAISNGNGYLVAESDSVTTLLSVESGRVVSQKKIDKIKYAEASKLTGEDKELLQYVGVNTRKVAYVKSVTISEGEPSVVLLNAFDKNDINLGGGIFIPAGLPIKCLR